MIQYSKILISAMVFFVSVPGHSQTIKWNCGINSFFDNREYFNDYAIPQTMFGTRLYGTGGFIFDNNFEINAGADILYEYGDVLRSDHVKPILFFRFNNKLMNFYAGSFPRKNLISLPLFLQTDTLEYYRPACEGMFLEVKKEWGSQSVWIDWISRQADDINEVFQIGGTGILQSNFLFYRHDFIMTHYANPAVRKPGDHIHDNGGLHAAIGTDLSAYLFDSLTISTGYCFSYDQVRHVYNLKFYHGSLTQLYIELSNIGIRTTNYFGDGQVQLMSDNLYRARFYNRIDFVWHIFRTKNIKGVVEFSVHKFDSVINISQSFKIHAILEGRRKEQAERRF